MTIKSIVYRAPERSKPYTRSIFTVGDRIGYSKAFLRNIGTSSTDDAWRRQGVIVAISGEITPEYPHWRTKAAQAVPDGLILVRWNDQTYPIVHEDGESQSVHAVQNSAIAKVGGAKYAEDIP